MSRAGHSRRPAERGEAAEELHPFQPHWSLGVTTEFSHTAFLFTAYLSETIHLWATFFLLCANNLMTRIEISSARCWPNIKRAQNAKAGAQSSRVYITDFTVFASNGLCVCTLIYIIHHRRRTARKLLAGLSTDGTFQMRPPYLSLGPRPVIKYIVLTLGILLHSAIRGPPVCANKFRTARD